VRRQHHVEQASDGGIVSCAEDGGSARRTGVGRRPRRGRNRRILELGGLKAKPVLDTHATETVQAIDEGQRLIEEIGAYLEAMAKLARASLSGNATSGGSTYGARQLLLQIHVEARTKGRSFTHSLLPAAELACRVCRGDGLAAPTALEGTRPVLW
jgi:hypothetical protein